MDWAESTSEPTKSHLFTDHITQNMDLAESNSEPIKSCLFIAYIIKNVIG